MAETSLVDSIKNLLCKKEPRRDVKEAKGVYVVSSGGASTTR